MGSASGQSGANVGTSVRIKGQIVGDEDLYVDGQMDGSIDLQNHKLTIGPNARVQADVKAQDVIIIGEAMGTIEAAGRIELHAAGKLVGDIKAARIVIEDGAYFKGSIEIIRSKPVIEIPRERAASA